MAMMNCVGAQSSDPERVARALEKEPIFQNINRLMDKVDDQVILTKTIGARLKR